MTDNNSFPISEMAKVIGRRGGEATFARYGKEHYSKAGKNKKGKKSPGSGRRKLTSKTPY